MAAACPPAGPAATSLGGRLRMAVLFGVRTIAVAVLEIDAEVFDRLAPQLLDDRARTCRANAAVDAVARSSSAGASVARVGRVLVERRQRQRAELRRRVRAEQMRAAVDGVHRLPVAGLAGIRARDARVARFRKSREDAAARSRGRRAI